MLEIGERCRRFELVMDEDIGCHRLDLVIDRRKFFVVRGDQADRLLGDVRIGGKHDRDRLADKAYFAVRQDRLIVESGTVIRMRNRPCECRRW